MNFNELLNNKKFFADMLLSSCKNKDDITDIRFFTNVSDISIYTDTQHNDYIVCVYADYFDIYNDISTASVYFRISKINTVNNKMNTSLYNVEYLNMLDCH